jgi:hypothetical protein
MFFLIHSIKKISGSGITHTLNIASAPTITNTRRQPQRLFWTMSQEQDLPGLFAQARS